MSKHQDTEETNGDDHPITIVDSEIDAQKTRASGYQWLLYWFGLNIGLTLMNKAFLSLWGFAFPVTLSCIHSACSVVCSWVAIKLMDIPLLTLNAKEQFLVFLFSLLFSANIVVGNVSIRFVSVSLVQVVRSTIPGLTIILSMLILGKKYKSNYFYAIAFVVIGVAMASLGEVKFHMFGFIMTIIVCLLSSIKSVLSSKFLSGWNFHPMEFLLYMSFHALYQMLLVGYLVGEHHKIVNVWWPYQEKYKTQLFATMVLLGNGFMAFFLNFTNFMTTKKLSALTVTVGGNIKHVSTIVLSVILFHDPITVLNLLGTTIAIMGAAYYSYIDYIIKL